VRCEDGGAERDGEMENWVYRRQFVSLTKLISSSFAMRGRFVDDFLLERREECTQIFSSIALSLALRPSDDMRNPKRGAFPYAMIDFRMGEV